MKVSNIHYKKLKSPKPVPKPIPFLQASFITRYLYMVNMSQEPSFQVENQTFSSTKPVTDTVDV